jgi:exportin-2 (importin alpha re-exporter)
MESVQTMLVQSLSPDLAARRYAEQELARLGSQAGFASVLVQIMNDPTQAVAQQAAAILLKNTVKKNWEAIAEQEREAVKAALMQMICKSPRVVQRQIITTMALICKDGFAAQWPALVPGLTASISHTKALDSAVVLHDVKSVLMVANGVFERFQSVSTDLLQQEHAYVLGMFSEPLFNVFTLALQVLNVPGVAEAVQVEVIRILFLGCRIFYSLSWVSAVPRPQLDGWIAHFSHLLAFDSPTLMALQEELLLSDQGDEATGPFQHLLGAVFDNLQMYTENYKDAVVQHLPGYLQVTCSLLVKLPLDDNNEVLATSAMEFLTAAIGERENHHLFADGTMVSQICECIVWPSLRLPEAAEEMFSAEEEEYVRLEINGSSLPTRRKCARELLVALFCNFREEITRCLPAHIESGFQQYHADPAANWRQKDVSVYAMQAIMSVISKHPEPAFPIDPIKLFLERLAPELQVFAYGQSTEFAALFGVSTGIKYVSAARAMLPPHIIDQVLPVLVGLVQCQNIVIHSFAANCIEKMLSTKAIVMKPGQAGGDFSASAQWLVQAEQLKPHLMPLLAAVFTTFAATAYAENEYLMKAAMRAVSVALRTTGMFQKPANKGTPDSAGDMPLPAEVLQQLTAIVGHVCSNPTNPEFSHYLFESIAAIIQGVCALNSEYVADFETALFPPFEAVLGMSVEEFHPYVLQILTQMMQVRQMQGRQQAIQAHWVSLVAILLQPAVWECKGNVPAAVPLVNAYMRVSPSSVLQHGHLVGILQVGQILISDIAHESEGFDLLCCVAETIATAHPAEFEPFRKNLWGMLFQQLNTPGAQGVVARRSIKFLLGFTRFSLLFIGKCGSAAVKADMEAAQPGSFLAVLQGVWLPTAVKESDEEVRKACAIGLTDMLTKTELAPACWVEALRTAITLLEDEGEECEEEEDEQLALEESWQYQAKFSPLHHAGIIQEYEQDPYSEVEEAALHLAEALSVFFAANPGGAYQALAQQSLDAAQLAALGGYFEEAGCEQ